MLPFVLQRIVDEYVGQGFTNCEIASRKCAEWVGDLGTDYVLIREAYMYKIWNVVTNEVKICPFQGDGIGTTKQGYLARVIEHILQVFDVEFRLVCEKYVSEMPRNIFFFKDMIMLECEFTLQGYNWRDNSSYMVVGLSRPENQHLHYTGQICWHNSTCSDCGVVHDKHMWYAWTTNNSMHIEPYPYVFHGTGVCEFGEEDVFLYDSEEWRIGNLEVMTTFPMGQTKQSGTFRYDILDAHAMSRNRIVVHAASRELIVLM